MRLRKSAYTVRLCTKTSLARRGGAALRLDNSEAIKRASAALPRVCRGRAQPRRVGIRSRVKPPQYRTEIGAHYLPVNVRAHPRKRAQIFDRLPCVAAINSRHP